MKFIINTLCYFIGFWNYSLTYISSQRILRREPS